MAKRVLVLINAGAGAYTAGGVEATRLAVARALAEHHLAAELHVVDGAEVGTAAAAAAAGGAPTVVAAGGDGTVSAVAHALVGTGTALGVLPLGTLNHFAKDLGVPLDLPAAAAVIAQGEWRAIDAGEVNGRRFINNSSIGIYPDLVLDRERQRRELGRRKYTAMAIAAVREVREMRKMRVRIDAIGHRLSRRVSFVFIGNNQYDFDGLRLGKRARLDGGKLWLYVPVGASRLIVLRLIGAKLLRRLNHLRHLRSMPVAEATLRLRQRRVAVGIDGEVVQLRPPLRYRILAGALRVLAPAPGAAP